MKNKNILITILIILLLAIICCICSVLISFLVYKNSNSISYSRTIWQGDYYAEFFSSNDSKKLVDPALYTLIKCYDRNHKQFASYNPDSNDYRRFALDNDLNYANSFDIKSCKPITNYNFNSNNLSYVRTIQQGDYYAELYTSKDFYIRPVMQKYTFAKCFDKNKNQFAETILTEEDNLRFGFDSDWNLGNSFDIKNCKPITNYNLNPDSLKSNSSNSSNSKIGISRITDQVAIDIVKEKFPHFEGYGIEEKFFAGSTVFVQTNLLDSNIKYVGMAVNGSGVLFVEPITCFEVNLNNQSAKKIGSYKTTDSDDSKFISDLTLNYSYYSSFANVFDLATCKMK